MIVPTFSIIVPVYKVEKYLKRCIESILCQTFRDYELILVDDGSPDNSGNICDGYADKDERITVFHQDNSGASEARNTGIRNAQGEFILFVDADDCINSDKCLEDVYEALNRNKKVDLLCWGLNVINEDKTLMKVRTPSLTTTDADDKYSVLQKMIYRNEYISTSYCKAIRRSLIEDNQIYFMKGLKSEDIEWTARLMVLCRDIGAFEAVYYDRIMRAEDSLTGSIGKQNVVDILGQIEDGTEFARIHAESSELLDLYYEYWAYQYAMLLGFCRRASKYDDYQVIKDRIKKLSWLLKYDHVKKVKLVHMLYKILGQDLTMIVLEQYYKTK